MNMLSRVVNLSLLSILVTIPFTYLKAEAPNLGACTEVTATFSSADVPKAIPAEGAVSSVLNIAGTGTYIIDVDLSTNITHTFNADLDITLQSPSGTVTTVTTDNASGNDNVFNGTLFDDQAETPVTDNTYVNLTPASPLVVEGALGKFKGEDPNGTWTLNITDDLSGDSGSLDNWSLTLTVCNGDAPGTANIETFTNSIPVAIIDNNVIEPAFSAINVSGMVGKICDLSMHTNISHTFSADMDIYLTAPNGAKTTISTDNGAGNDNVFSNTIFTDGGTQTVTDQTYVNNVAVTDITPEGALSKFDGLDPNGEWKLTVADDITSDTGNIESWSLTIQTCGTDTDADTVADLTDNCPDTPNTVQTDTDNDGFGDACDECFENVNKVDAGLCGCAVADVDIDGDGAIDCVDSCPADPNKSAPGACGCGVPDVDSDASGITDCLAAQETANIKTKLLAVKFTTNSKKLKAAKAKMKEVLNLVKSLDTNVLNNSSILVFTAGHNAQTAGINLKDLKKFVKKSRKGLKLGVKTDFSQNRKKASKKADELQAAFGK